MWTCLERRNARGKGIGEEIALPIYNDDDGDGDGYKRILVYYSTNWGHRNKAS